MWRPNRTPTPEIDVRETKEKFENGEIKLLDVREADEWDQAHIAGAQWIPLGQLQQRYAEVSADQKWVIVCHSGGRSAAATDFLRGQGVDATNMSGGMLAWARQRFPMESGRGDQ